MQPTPDYGKQAEEIAERHIVIQELQDYLDKNNLSEGEKLNLRLLRNLYVNDIKTGLQMEPIRDHTEVCKDNPSLTWLIRNKLPQTIITLFTVSAFAYFFLRIIEIMTGLEGMLKLLTP